MVNDKYLLLCIVSFSIYVLWFIYFNVSTPISNTIEHKTCIGDVNVVHSKKLIAMVKETYDILEGTDATVHAGTLLHFYRDCTLKADTNDIDFVISYNLITKELEQKFLDNGFKKIRDFGVMQTPGYETSFRHPSGMKIDLFGEVSTEYYDWAPLWVNEKVRKCRYPTTRVGQLVIGENEIIKVREPIIGILESLYGQQWREPIPTSKWSWINPVCT